MMNNKKRIILYSIPNAIFFYISHNHMIEKRSVYFACLLYTSPSPRDS